MSTSNTSPVGGNATAIPAEVEGAILEAFANGIRPSLGFILVGTIFSSMLIPILVVLFYFSTPNLRKQPIFIANVISILLGIVLGIYNAQLELSGILNPTKAVSVARIQAYGLMLELSPWLADYVLAFRLLVVYPPYRTSKRKLALVFAIPTIAMLIRLSAIATYYCLWNRDLKTQGGVVQVISHTDYRHTPWSSIDWFSRIFVNGYLSTIFIWKMYSSHIFHHADGARVSFGITDSLSSRLKSLFWIAISNFIFPVMLDIAFILDLYLDPNYIVGTASIQIAEYYVTVIGVVFATVWSSGFNYKQQAHSVAKKSSALSSWRVARPNTSNSTEDSESIGMSKVQFAVPSNLELKTSKELGWENAAMQNHEREVIPLQVCVEQSREQAYMEP